MHVPIFSYVYSFCAICVSGFYTNGIICLFIDFAPGIFQRYGTVEYQMFRSRILIDIEVSDTLEL